MDTLRDLVLEVYDQIVGLELADMAVDGAVSPRLLAAARKRAAARWIEENKVSNARRLWICAGHIPLGTVTASSANRHDSSPLLTETLDAVAETLRELPERVSVHLDRGYYSKATRERLEEERGLLARSPRRASRPR